MEKFEKYITEAEINTITEELGKKITEDYKNKELFVLCITKGAFIFAADLVRKIKLDFQISFLRASSYGSGTESLGKVDIEFQDHKLVTNKDVLVIEDIVDTGNTVVAVNEILEDFNPRSIRWASLLSKPSRRIIEVDVEYIGREIEDKFVVGYGLDLNEKYRNIPYIAIYSDNTD